MNKRIVLVDSNEFKNYSGLYGIGLDSNSIYTIQYLESIPEPERKKILDLGNTDAALLVGGEPFKYLRQFYHYGIRNENYADCAKLRRLSIEGGAFLKCTLDIPEPDVVADFLSEGFTVHRDFSWFKQKVIHTFEEAMIMIDYMDSLPEDTNYGFDYEASGFSNEIDFEISGASISTISYAGFISFTDIRHQVLNSTPEKYQTLLQRLRDFLEKRQDHIWVFNLQYEYQVSHRMLNGVDLYNLCDAGVFNVLDGNHLLKKYSLKWTANMILQSTVWDTEFDRISDLIDSMLFEVVGKLKKDKHKELKVTKENYKETPEWKELCKRYPNYIQEFEQLILEYWGNPFMCIPSDILGYYCNLDSFYTLMIYEERKDMYSQEAINVFLDNARLGARLHSSGLYIDEEYRLKYQHECHKMMAWGITYCAMARCWIKMEKHKNKMANINKYNPICKKLLDLRMFYNGDAIEITKNLLIKYVDIMEAYESGLNEGELLMTFGDKFAEDFINIVQESKTEIKFKAKMDETIGKKKKLISTVAGKLTTLIGLDKLKLGEKHLELEKYIYYEQAYNELKRVTVQVMPNVENIPDQGIKAFGQEFSLLDYADYVSDNYFRARSAIENDTMIDEFFQLYRTQSAFLAALSESVQQLPGTDKHSFFKDRNCKTIDDAYNYFMNEWQNYCADAGSYNGDFPDKIFDEALKCWRKGISYEPSKNEKPLKDVFSDFNGLYTQIDFFGEYKNQIDQYSTPFDPKDLTNDFFFMRKFVINYLLFKKYSKVLSTYIDGMFKANNRWVIEDEKHIPIRDADPNEPGAIEKCFVHYDIQMKSSKRSSSGFHTIKIIVAY